MDTLSKIWPFVPGQQELIFDFTGAAIIGIIVLNVASALRQELPVQAVFSSLFSPVGTKSRAEKVISVILLVWAVTGFLILVADTQINGMQLINLQELNNK